MRREERRESGRTSRGREGGSLCAHRRRCRRRPLQGTRSQSRRTRGRREREEEGALFQPSGPQVADFLRLHSCEMFSADVEVIISTGSWQEGARERTHDAVHRAAEELLVLVVPARKAES